MFQYRLLGGSSNETPFPPSAAFGPITATTSSPEPSRPSSRVELPSPGMDAGPCLAAEPGNHIAKIMSVDCGEGTAPLAQCLVSTTITAFPLPKPHRSASGCRGERWISGRAYSRPDAGSIRDFEKGDRIPFAIGEVFFKMAISAIHRGRAYAIRPRRYLQCREASEAMKVAGWAWSTSI